MSHWHAVLQALRISQNATGPITTPLHTEKEAAIHLGCPRKATSVDLTPETCRSMAQNIRIAFANSRSGPLKCDFNPFKIRTSLKEWLLQCVCLRSWRMPVFAILELHWQWLFG